ncbi:MAG: hypothetical protein KJO95_06685 [Gammaproteobacteria bacterium]|nr:hypothetical protein [Gammaproteobacteria bacterium]
MRLILPGFALLLGACASHEGLYEPSCIAFEGDRIALMDGRFEWQRFTDQRVVDDDGKIVKPFPGFPKTGTYKLMSGQLELVTAGNERLDNWFMVKKDGQNYLLTAKQHTTFINSGKLHECALRLSK